MGCGSSLSNTNLECLDFTSTELKLNYRQFVINTRGQISDIYDFSTVINRSSVAIIRKVIHRKSKNERVCKIIPIENLKQLSCINEVEVIKNLEHPNASKIYEYFIEKDRIFIVFELIDGFTLKEFSKTEKKLSLKSIIDIMRQLLFVLNMMHSQNIAHRMINPGHIMLEEKGEDYLLKLLDFSESYFYLSPKLKHPRIYKDEKAFSSPESESFPLKYDIYCCGLIFLILLGGSSVLHKIRGNEEKVIFDFFKEKDQLADIKSLIIKMLHPQSLKRPTVSDTLNDVIFKQEFLFNKEILTNVCLFRLNGSLQTIFWMFAAIKCLKLKHSFEVVKEFEAINDSHSGKIQFKEMKNALMKTYGYDENIASQQCEEIFIHLDINKNREIEFYEFLMSNLDHQLVDKFSKEIFEEIDLNNDGILTNDEIYIAVEGIEDLEIGKEQIVSLNFEEFYRILMNKKSVQKNMSL